MSEVLTPEGLILASIQETKNEVKTFGEKINTLAKPEDIASAVKKSEETISAEVKKANDAVEEVKTSMAAMKTQVDELDKKAGKLNLNNPGKPRSFRDAIREGLKTIANELGVMTSKNTSVTLELKEVADMSNSASLTGDGVQTYNGRQGLVPAQKLNFRDLISTIISPTLEFVTYRETGSEGSISNQTEGSAKTQIDYDLTNVQVIQSYLAGFVRFTKQLLKNLPWLGGTLPRLLLRDFYKAENASFFSTAYTAATEYVSAYTEDVEQIISAIAELESNDFTASFGLVSKQQWARLAIATYGKGYYAGAGSVVITAAGMITIAGVPILSASWVTDDKLLLLDVDYIERVEGEALNIQFAYEDADNFTKNKVTARVECMEVLNILRPDALLKMDFGNVTP